MGEQAISAKELMPNSTQTTQILKSRAEKLAQPYIVENETEKELFFLQFKLNDDALYGVPQTMLDEVIDTEHLTRLNWLPPFIAGVINWKGKVLSVLDTNYLCSEMNMERVAEKYTIVVVTNGEKKVGLMVNEIDEFFCYKKADLKTSLQSPIKFNKDYFLGLLNDSVVILNIDMVLTDLALEIK
ncbi:MAG: chemotaxis protein CheW [Methylococcales bacterium]|nr:chemotaxis protein CheW [Methylococcales bacterium]